MLTLAQLKDKSAATTAGLMSGVKEASLALIELCYNRGVYIRITQGLRTIAEQNALYAQGRDKPGNIVTNAKGGYSNHNFGTAIDFVLLSADGKNVYWDRTRTTTKENKTDWNIVVEIAKSLGFEWGGDWKSFKDYPHFEMCFGLATSQYRSGKRPTAAAIAGAIALSKKLLGVKKEDEIDMDLVKELQAEIADLKKQVTELSKVSSRVESLEKAHKMDVPTWAKSGVDALVAKKAVDTPEGGSMDFYRFAKILKSLKLI